MKANTLCLSFLLLCIGGGLVSCGRSKTNDRKKLIVGTNASYPPYEYVDHSGKTVGFDIDLAHAIAKKIGREAEIREFSFDALIINLQKKRIDCIIAGVSITPEREEKMVMVPYFGDEIKELGLVFWEKIPSCPLDFSQYKFLVVQTGTIQEKFICSLKTSRVKSLENTLDLIMELKYKKSDVAVVEPGIVPLLKKKFPEILVVMQPLPDSWKIMGNGIGINTDDQELILDIRQAIYELKEEGFISDLKKKWFEDKLVTNKET